MAIKVQAGYMRHAHESPRSIARTAREHLEGVEFDTMVGTGLSGALVIPPLARTLKVHWLILRKPTDDSHSCMAGEGTLGSRWLFVDDLIDSGATQARVIKQVNEIIATERARAHLAGGTLPQARYVGYYLYNGFGRPGFTAPAEDDYLRRKHPALFAGASLDYLGWKP